MKLLYLFEPSHESEACEQVSTQEAPISTFAQEEGRILPPGSEGAWDEEALGHPVVCFQVTS